LVVDVVAVMAKNNAETAAGTQRQESGANHGPMFRQRKFTIEFKRRNTDREIVASWRPSTVGLAKIYGFRHIFYLKTARVLL
jgi:hypothetical protein